MTARLGRYVLPAVLLLAVLAGNVVITHNVLTQPAPGHNDFMSRWEGARSFFVDGISPYSEQATLNIQQRIFGRPVVETEDPGLFAYPFYTVFIVWPTVYLDYAWASAVWMVFLEVCLIGALILLLDLYEWRPAPWLLGVMLLWALLDYYAARGLILGQPSHLVYVLQVAAIWGLYRRQDSLAGAALAASTLKPQMGYLLVPFLLLWAVRTGRWRFVEGFGVVLGLLAGVSLALEPTWLGDWLAQVREYPVYTAAAYPDTGSPVWIITQHYLGLGAGGEWLVSLLFIVPMLWAWYTVLVQRRDERMLWAVVLTLLVTHLVALRTATPHFVVFNVAIVFYLLRIARTRGNLSVAGTVFTLFITSWALFAITIPGRDAIEHPVLFLPLPLALFALVWITRRLWWDKAPQISADHAETADPLAEAAT
jgi:hypothetical protein